MNGFDLAYGLGVGVSAPFWLIKPSARRKVLSAFRQRMGRGIDLSRRDLARPAVLIHAVSLGEINATRALIDLLRADRPGLQFVVTTTTQTGYERGLQLYGNQADVTLIRYPLDFSCAISRVLDQLRPSVVVLIELEIWPNFLAHCKKRGIPVILVNGRITPSSYRNYRRGAVLVRPMLRQLAELCVQDEAFAEQFRSLGAPPDRIHITGTMKFDTATVADRIDGDAQLAAEVGIDRSAGPVWICGSTGPGEESIVLEVYRRLLVNFPTLQLAIIPRKPERFDEVAKLIVDAGFTCVRRSETAGSRQQAAGSGGEAGSGQWAVGSDNPQSAIRNPQSPPPVVLGDTMGELRKFYSLADVVFVGRTLVDLGHRQHGSDMIEPAALAKPVIVGPYTHNFADAMRKFRAADAIVEVDSADALESAVRRFLKDPPAAQTTGQRAQEVVRTQQGATRRHADFVLKYLG